MYLNSNPTLKTLSPIESNLRLRRLKSTANQNTRSPKYSTPRLIVAERLVHCSDELSVAALQGYLLKNKTRPRECVEEVAEWVVQERQTREKLKKEKAEKEAKEKKEAEEREQKEKEEKEAKEKEEQETKEKLEKETRSKAKQTATVAKESLSVEPSTSPSTNTASSLSESSSSESENSSGVDADTEESVTSEEESDKDGSVAAKDTTKEKWIAVANPASASPPATSDTPNGPP
ncbi:hypothetical protein DFJ43DRAFT_73528 [Lentinula guzmanii]|uniref:Mitochondrial chaperone BCS1-like ATPase lid domain-containing protein n=1 Tax=Lentinula guzmanii TaxID=2804957 RepID=A0AA38N2I6_9AGAR|nr:hypothetical protein DFJ43DRAFT_73528 [Lentinula guzmanii]